MLAWPTARPTAEPICGQAWHHVVWSVAAIAVGFVPQYFTALEFPGLAGSLHSASVIHLIMSILFIGMLYQNFRTLGLHLQNREPDP